MTAGSCGRSWRVWCYWIGDVFAVTVKGCVGETGGLALSCQMLPCSSVENAPVPVDGASGTADA